MSDGPVRDGLVWEQRPTLRRPVLVAAFAGWNDAGDAATGAADWLVGHGHGAVVARIDADEHLDYQSRRPQIQLVGGVARAVTWPANTFTHVRFDDRDLVVLRGIEPNLRWRSFCRAVLAVADGTGCELVVTLGALLGDTPHTRGVRVTGTATDDDLVARLDLARSRYEGPTGIVGVLHDACGAAGAASASLWAPVPHYASAPPIPPATRALLARLATLLDVTIDLRGLDRLAELWRARVDRAVADNDELSHYVRELEGRVDIEDAEEHGVVLGGHPAGSTGESATGGSIADEVEQFLREQGEQT